MRTLAKVAGLGVGVTGLVGYGALRLALWPARVLWRRIGPGEKSAAIQTRVHGTPEMQRPR